MESIEFKGHRYAMSETMTDKVLFVSRDGVLFGAIVGYLNQGKTIVMRDEVDKDGNRKFKNKMSITDTIERIRTNPKIIVKLIKSIAL